MTSVTTASPSGGFRVPPLAVALLVPVTGWAILFLLIPPGRQDFPFSDDWVYSRGVFAFCRGEGLQYYSWSAVPALGQWLWTCPFIWLLGESYATLRLATLGLGLLGGAAFYDLVRREGGVADRQAAFATAALLLCPMFFVLAGTYMTDVPALALSLMSLALYARALRDGRVSVLLAAAAVAVLAVITRQNTVTAPAAAGVCLLWRYPQLRWRPIWLLSVVLPGVIWVVTSRWFLDRPDTVKWLPCAPGPERLSALFWLGSMQLGLAALPMLVLQPGLGSRRSFLVALGLLLVGVAFWAAHRRFVIGQDITSEVPYVGNIITPWGVYGVPLIVGGRPPLLLDLRILALAVLAGLVAAASLWARLASWFGRDLLGDPLLLFSFFHLPFLLISVTDVDKYLLVLFPGALYLATWGPREARLRWPAGLALLGAIALLSFALMHDWLAWNSARWEVGRRALARGVAVEDIEGGFEWDGWHLPGRHLVPLGSWLKRDGIVWRGNPLQMPEITGRYALAIRELPDTVCVDSEPYFLWLAPGERHFLLLEWKPSAQDGR
jgi:4-amino-4-deoxy-L-arabinose transferase-like glycosyltransferase